MHQRHNPPYLVLVDLDDTLLTTSSASLIMKKLIKERILSCRQLAGIILFVFLYQLNIIKIQTLFSSLASFLKGLSAKAVAAFHQDWFHEIAASHFRQSLVRELKIHQEKGAKIVLLSAACEQTCAPIASALGIYDIICSQLELKDGIFTGRLDGLYCYGDEKVRRARQFIEHNGLSLVGSYYYGDSHDADIAMMHRVETPICVDPDRKLRQQARKNGWQVIDGE
jgi:putative phosphoserine phosphatase/1-acylglycerol-3-phosphate O-acyltransferase